MLRLIFHSVVHRITVKIIRLEAINTTLLQLVKYARNHVPLPIRISRIHCQDMHQILPFVILLLHFLILWLFLDQCKEQLEFLLIKCILHRFQIVIALLNDQVSDTQLATVDGDSKSGPRWPFRLNLI